MEIATENLVSNSEHWASIDGYRNYEVSWWGRVRKIDTGRILKNCPNTSGYFVVSLGKHKKWKTHYIHQLVAREWVSNPEEKRCVDHIDGNRANNNWENLRYATHAENSRNRKKHANGSSVYKGVYMCNRRHKWVASIHTNEGHKHLGYYSDEREAAESYNTAAVEHFGEFAKLNELD